ncbi:hypothetical protein [Arthrobacter sp. 24S4-2]|uniref:hypothetical protein n=1 Tax=Arthrobacter sp. 24S4-2 TaxID=2575374 RepID=UPI0020C7A8A4|nr:hypothetical protein [Arthrobacter sp. 24S4-2]
MAQNCTITWTPTEEQRHESRLWSFMRWVAENRGVQTTTYREIWRWSVEEVPAFWGPCVNTLAFSETDSMGPY